MPKRKNLPAWLFSDIDTWPRKKTNSDVTPEETDWESDPEESSMWLAYIDPHKGMYNEQKYDPRELGILMEQTSEISNEEYDDFYHNMTSKGDYMGVKHFSVKGVTGLVFLPQSSKTEYTYVNYTQQLAVRNFEEAVPSYLNFLKGVVDWHGQQLIKNISSILANKCIELLEQIAEDKDNYMKFYQEFGESITLGIQEDLPNRMKLVDLLRYHSTQSGDEMTCLKEYVTRMKGNQKHIYFTIGNNDTVERLRKRGLEVMYMEDPIFIELFTTKQLTEYHSKPIIVVTGGDMELPVGEQLEYDWVAMCPLD